MFLEPFVTKASQPSSSSAQPKRTSTRVSKSPTFDDASLQVSSANRQPSGFRQRIRRELSGSLMDLYGRQSSQSQGTHQMDLYANSTPDHGLGGSQSLPIQNESEFGQVALAPEQQIDIEQAINLLQELKKTATPDELVALHRALLPTREAVSTQHSPMLGQSEGPTMPRASRRMTTIPPGLATRAGLDVDLLRRPEEASLQSKFAHKQRRVSQQAAPQIPHIALTTVNMADDTSSMAGNQNTTPTDSAYIHTGMYRHGTLRVINGAETPEPSIMTDANLDTQIAEHGYTNISALKIKTEFLPAGTISWDRPSHLTEKQHQNDHTLKPNSRDDRHETKDRSSGEKRNENASSRKRESSGQFAIVPTKWSDVPKSYPQMHSAEKHLSLGHDVDYETVSNPYEERRSADFQDWTHNIADERGITNPRELSQERLQEANKVKLSRRMIWGEDDIEEVDSPSSNITAGTRPTSMHHPDSGYGSDAAPQTVRNRASREVRRFENIDAKSFPNSPAGGLPETPIESPTSPRKSCLFSRIQSNTAERRERTSAQNQGYNARESTASSPSSPAGPRKLQKSIPKSVMRQREAEIQKQKEDEVNQTLGPDFDRFQKPPSRPPPPPPHTSTEPARTPAEHEEGRNYPERHLEPPGDADRPSRKRSQSHGRERSDKAEGQLNTFAVSRVRSKSLGRDLIRNPDRSMYDASRQRAIDNKNQLLPVLSNRRSIPLQTFQHERTYQIQPGSVMSKSGNATLSVSSPELVRVRSEENPSSSMQIAEQRCRPSLRQTKSHGNGSDGVVWAPEDSFHTAEILSAPRELPTPPHVQQSRSQAAAIPDLPIPISDVAVTTDTEQTILNHSTGNYQQHQINKRENWVEQPQGYSVNTKGGENDITTTSAQRWHQEAYHPHNEQVASLTYVAELPDWESQAKLWRERRQAADANLNNSPPKPPVHSSLPGSPTRPAPLSVTRLLNDGRQLASPSPPPTGTASEQANAYRNLIMRNDDNRPAKDDVLRTDSAQSTSTFYTVQSTCDHPIAAKLVGPRPPSSLSIVIPSKYHSAPTSRKTSHESQNSQAPAVPSQYLPYRPQNAVQVQHLRMQSEPQPITTHQNPGHPAGGLEPVLDRYGGGLGFNWDRTAGFRGSAGFRANNANRSDISEDERSRMERSRAGQKYGIDLSDVPVFLQRI